VKGPRKLASGEVIGKGKTALELHRNESYISDR